MTKQWFNCDFCSSIQGRVLCEKTLDEDGFADYCVKEKCNQIEINGMVINDD